MHHSNEVSYIRGLDNCFRAGLIGHSRGRTPKEQKAKRAERKDRDTRENANSPRNSVRRQLRTAARPPTCSTVGHFAVTPGQKANARKQSLEAVLFLMQIKALSSLVLKAPTTSDHRGYPGHPRRSRFPDRPHRHQRRLELSRPRERPSPFRRPKSRRARSPRAAGSGARCGPLFA